MTATDPAARRAEGQRLFAEHQAIRAEITPRQDARTAESEAAASRHAAASDAHDAALDLLAEAHEALRLPPGDPERRAAYEAASQTADAAFAHAESEYRAARDIHDRLSAYFAARDRQEAADRYLTSIGLPAPDLNPVGDRYTCRR